MFDIRSLTWDEWSYQREWSFLLLLWGLSDPRIAELREMPKSFIIKLYSETQVSGRLGMSGGISPRHAQNHLSGERWKTLSITHHALSPPPSHHHLYIIHLINWLQRFYRIIMSLKRPFVPKSDVKQWFTTTTTVNISFSMGSSCAFWGIWILTYFWLSTMTYLDVLKHTSFPESISKTTGPITDILHIYDL